MSAQVTFDTEGLEEFQNLMEEFAQVLDPQNVIKVLKKGADAFTSDLLKLPRPRSRIHAAGYTHMVDVFANRVRGSEVEVGWGKDYGPMVEHGTVRMRAQPHLKPAFNSNSQKYYKIMTEELWKGAKG